MNRNNSCWLYSIALAVPLIIATGGGSWAAGERVGNVTDVQPAATITTTDAEPAVVTVNSGVSMADILRTDVNGFVKIEFKDGSKLTVNPGSNVTIDKYVYDGTTNAGTLVMSVGSGVARFVSGNMKKENIRINTPTATMGLRGTDLVIRTDGVNSEIEVLEGGINVSPCGTKDIYLVDKGQVLGVDYSCAVTSGTSGVAGGGAAAAATADAGPGPSGPGPSGPGPSGPGPSGPGPSDGPSGGPGNGNGNGGNAGNGGGNTGGSGPGSGNGGSNNGQGAGASNGGGGSGNGGGTGGGNSGN